MQLRIIHTLHQYHLQLTTGRTYARTPSGQLIISLSPATTSSGELNEESLIVIVLPYSSQTDTHISINSVQYNCCKTLNFQQSKQTVHTLTVGGKTYFMYTKEGGVYTLSRH